MLILPKYNSFKFNNPNFGTVNAIQTKFVYMLVMGEQIVSSLLIKTHAVSCFLLQLSFVYNQAFFFQHGEKNEDIYCSPLYVSIITGNILIMIKRFICYHLLFASNSVFMTDSMYLGTIQISQNLNEHCYCFI